MSGTSGRGPVSGWPAPEPRAAPIPRYRASGRTLGLAAMPALVEQGARGLLGRRRFVLVALLAAAPVLVSAVLAMGGGVGTPAALARAVYDTLLLAIVVPLVALILGTTALGGESDDGTLLHLMTKPVGRGWIVLAKVVVAAGATALLSGTSTLIAGLLLLGLDAPALLLGMLLAALVASVAYATVFVSVSTWTSRALVGGLAYVLLWEGFVASFFAGTRLLSIHEYARAIAATLAGSDAGDLASDVSGGAAILLACAVTAIAFRLAVIRLRRFEISDAG